MEAAIEFFVLHGSYLLMFIALIVAGFGVPFPEDIVMISGAILAQRGITNLPLTVIVLSLGVFVGDTVLYFLAKRVGTAVYEWRLVKRVMPEPRRRWLEAKIEKHGGLVVFVARNVAGFRGPTFALCAIHGISYPRFIFFDMLALTISLPIWMSLGWFFGDSIDQLMNHTATAGRITTVAALGLLLLLIAGHSVVFAVRQHRLSALPPPPTEDAKG